MLRPPVSREARPSWESRAGASAEPASRHGWGRSEVDAPSPTRSTSRRVIFINRFFFPDHSATSQILTDLAFHLAGGETEVRVVTSQQRYDDPNAHLPEAESIGGVAIHRISTTRFGRSALIGRGVDYLSFY